VELLLRNGGAQSVNVLIEVDAADLKPKKKKSEKLLKLRGLTIVWP
jgi:hypothetical protein